MNFKYFGVIIVLAAVIAFSWGCQNQPTSPESGESFDGIPYKTRVNANPSWRVQARCFQDGPSGSFDDIAVKDPSIVYSGGRYHLFYTGRDNNDWRMGYASASSISGLSSASHTYMSTLNVGSYFCAPQVFYCEAKGQWYLVYQSGQGATYSTNSDVGNPNGWSAGRSMFSGSYLDYWIIREGNTMYIFYAPGDDSRTIKRRSTSVSNFPSGWGGESTVATNTFEGLAVYKNNADGQYYMVVEDINRHFELWRASSPGGSFTKLSEEWAHRDDLIYEADHWTDQVSHGEILRAGTNEYMEVNNLDDCTIIFQGVPDGNYGEYWQIPYDIGTMRNGGGSTTTTSGYTTTTSGGTTTTSGGGSNSFVIRARGTGGGEHIALQVDGNTIASWNLTTSYQNYSASTNNTGGTLVCFDNDDGENMDVQIDYMDVNGSRRQAEDQSYNTGVWQDGDCGGEYSEWLHCEGCIGFGDVSGGGGSTTTSGGSTTTTASSWWGGGSWW
jgi:hypothetical protein